jgi:hypothetical protein
MGSRPVPVAPAPVGSAAVVHGGRWLVRELVELVLVVAGGTGVGLLADRLVGGLDGGPPAYLLVALALPFWDLLPAGLQRRLPALAGLVALLAAAWWGFAQVSTAGWWRGEGAFGLSCLLVGALPAVLLVVGDRRRTVQG